MNPGVLAESYDERDVLTVEVKHSTRLWKITILFIIAGDFNV